MRLLFVGLATVDLIQRVPRVPGVNEKIQSDSVTMAAGGPATNAAITAAALAPDYDVALMSAVGSHPLGALIKADLTAHGVTLIDATPDATDPPPVSAVTVLSTTGERTIVSHNAGTRAVPVPEMPEADLTLVDGHHPALARAAARTARRLLVDAGSWRPVFTEIFPLAEVVACSADFRHPSATAPAQAIAAPYVVVTHGPAPVQWFTAEAKGEVPVPQVKAVDTTGAGDAFHGALAVALTTKELPEAIAYAAHTAAIRVSHAGPRTWLTHLR
ncbi:PfkB family carbohydrate kinase [Actinoplanes derwentensis]|uniref:Sugar or nucleoside kinase, ribokinase family n=1 Tax=Actinoplanes derwentensis TaxID=113562 RepID=A0A1H2A291_9ACTN|nr:PfkB family carbohydrate kinase [Actinoplanes derwentensis]GID83413.1 ribokinase [Actinoplanes derwentensis]SDT40121.1 Sugar or nucleoside kinase, ribokinase family [Actinoplanes derwentensis]